MIIVMAPVQGHLNDARAIAASVASSPQTQEKIDFFGPNCFKNLTDERISFLGHGSSTHFGSSAGEENVHLKGMTAKEFVDRLIDYGLPSSVKTIDFLGCNVGLLKNSTCFALEVATYLSENPKYQHIQVKAFTNVDERELAKLVLITDEKGGCSLHGILPKDLAFYNGHSALVSLSEDQLKTLKTQSTGLGAEITTLQIQVTLKEEQVRVKRLEYDAEKLKSPPDPLKLATMFASILTVELESKEMKSSILEKGAVKTKTDDQIKFYSAFLKHHEDSRESIENSLTLVTGNNIRQCLDARKEFSILRPTSASRGIVYGPPQISTLVQPLTASAASSQSNTSSSAASSSSGEASTHSDEPTPIDKSAPTFRS